MQYNYDKSFPVCIILSAYCYVLEVGKINQRFMKAWNSTLSAAKKPMKRSKLRVAGVSDTTKIKQSIQSLVREIVILRDKGCILRFKRPCGGEIGKAVLQADHLVTRANSATYGDTRLIVCLCRPCHGGFKQWHKPEYDALVRTILPKERVALWDMAQANAHRPQKMDWKLVEIGLQQELTPLQD